MPTSLENDTLLNYAPICLFTYNRLNETIVTIEALKKNYLASKSELFIFIDGPRNKSDQTKVKTVLEFLKKIEGFQKVNIFESTINKGLAKSIISGVTQILELHGKVIVLEDDLITSHNFLNYMNQALDFYEQENKIFSISGYTMPLAFPMNYDRDHYFSVRASSWGWATWRDRWKLVDWEVTDYEQFSKSREKRQNFNMGGSDMSAMLKNQMLGKIDSWAIRWCYSQWKNKQLTVYPRISKVKNIGFTKNGSNTKHRVREFETNIDEGATTNFQFSSKIGLDTRILSLFNHNFSIPVRLKNKILKLLEF